MRSALNRSLKGSVIALLFLLAPPEQQLYAQAPDSINYQAVARDDQGKVLSGASLDVRMSIFSGGTLVYEEEHTGVTTNQFGLFDLYIGGGTQTGGSASAFDAIAWGSGPHQIEVEIDVGQGFESLGSRKLVSVPYALYADSSASGGGSGSLQSAYRGGNTITLDTSATPVSIESELKPHFHVDSSAVRMGHTNPIKNTQLDVRYDASPSPGPAMMAASGPVILPNSSFQNPAFQSNNTGVFGVGVGTQKAIGVTGFSVHNGSTPAAQDSIYGVTGLAVDRKGKTTVGVSGLARAINNNVQRSVGIYASVSDDSATDYQSDPFLAGGVFSASIHKGHTSLDTTYGAVGLGGSGGDHAIGVYGYGGGDTAASSQITYGLAGQAGISPDTNVGVVGQGNFAAGAGKSIAAWFRFGKTLVQDTLQVDYGSPSAGMVLTAVDNQGNAVWDTVGAGGGTASLQTAYNNGDSIALSSGGLLKFTNSGSSHDYLYALDGNPSLAIGHQQPVGTVGGKPAALHLALPFAEGQALISGGDNTGGFDAALAMSENIDGSGAGGELRLLSNVDRLVMSGSAGSPVPILGISTSSPYGVIVGQNYLSAGAVPPQNGMIVEDTVGIGTQTPAHQHHIEGRTFSREGMLVDDTAHYRYDAPKAYNEGIGGTDFQAVGASGSNSAYETTLDGDVYFTSSATTTPASMAAALDLPDGAVVDSVIYHAVDSASVNIDLVLQKRSYGAGSSYTDITGTLKSTSGNSGGQTLYGIPSSKVAIDNKNFVYRIYALFPPAQGDDLRLSNVRVHYTVRKAE